MLNIHKNYYNFYTEIYLTVWYNKFNTNNTYNIYVPLLIKCYYYYTHKILQKL